MSELIRYNGSKAEKTCLIFTPYSCWAFACMHSGNRSIALPSWFCHYHLISNPLEGLPKCLVLEGGSDLVAEWRSASRGPIGVYV